MKAMILLACSAVVSVHAMDCQRRGRLPSDDGGGSAFRDIDSRVVRHRSVGRAIVESGPMVDDASRQSHR